MTTRVSFRFARTLGIVLIALWMFAALRALADTGAPVGTGEEALIAALLHAVTHGHWWMVLAAAGGLTIAVLRRSGHIVRPWLAAVASVALAVAGGVLHYWMAGAPWDAGMLGTALRIALPMVLATLIPVAEPDHRELSPSAVARARRDQIGGWQPGPSDAAAGAPPQGGTGAK